MKVGDLVRYKDWPDDGYGVILKKDNDYILVHFWDVALPPHQLWEDKDNLETICK